MPSTPEQPPQPAPHTAVDPKQTLRLIPLEDTVVFPSMGITLTVEVGDDERVVLVPRHENEFLEVGTVAEVSEQLRLPGGGHAVAISGQHRALIGAAQTGPGGELRVEVDERPDEVPVDGKTRNLEREYRATVEEILELRGDDGRIAAFLRAIAEPGALADSAGYSPNLSYEQKVELLRTLDVTERLELAVKLQRESLAELQVRKRIREDVQEGAENQQREYFLRKQMESIRKELGEDEGSVAEEYRAKIEAAEMPEEVNEQALKELGRLERMGEQTGESSMIRTYLDWLIAVPWSKRSDERLDPVAARAVLDADHAGLEDVKDRITEYLAVRKLRADRGIEADPKSGAILTLIGPPGTGKTSIGESIARATGREFVRMSLGGVRDEAEIRGHRRTYIGALPGRLVRALRDAGTMNPVILLDEVDKVGADWRGDPSAALLEVLDPAQNHSFRDHYLDVELDLQPGDVPRDGQRRRHDPRAAARPDGDDPLRRLHLRGEARDRQGLPVAAPARPQRPARGRGRDRRRRAEDDHLRVHARGRREESRARAGDGAAQDRHEDRLQPVRGRAQRRDPDGDEQGHIPTTKATTKAKPKTKAKKPVKIDLEIVRDALGRQKFFQESASRTATPGVATGLAVTGAGGDVLFVEATAMKAGDSAPGNGLVLTGQLGDVMKESARIALSYVRGHAEELGIEESAFEGREFHVHVPAGAIPKDGPSAGVTMVTALASLLSGRPVKHTVGMTGEVTLQGRVLPIGGFKQKALAAHAAGLTDVILPERNRGDLDDIPEEVREQMAFHPVMTVQEVLDVALEPAQEPARDVAHA